VIPALKLQGASLPGALQALSDFSVKLDNEKRGVKITLEKAPDQKRNTADERPEITVRLNNIPLIEALRYVTTLTNHEFRVTDEGVVVSPLDAGRSEELRIYCRSIQNSLVEAFLREPKAFAVSRGVKFPPGSLVYWDAPTHTFYMKNTGPNVTIFDKAMSNAASQAIMLGAKDIAFPGIDLKNVTLNEAIDYLKSSRARSKGRGPQYNSAVRRARCREARR
jgi:hypothetical protein